MQAESPLTNQAALRIRQLRRMLERRLAAVDLPLDIVIVGLKTKVRSPTERHAALTGQVNHATDFGYPLITAKVSPKVH